MTPDEHAAEAERLLAHGKDLQSQRADIASIIAIGMAQVHATLSLREASAPSAPPPAPQSAGLVSVDGTPDPAQPRQEFPLSQPGVATQAAKPRREQELDQIWRDLDNP